MSATIDERVVEMRFDNAQFEKNAKNTLSTLDKLKSALKLSDSAKAMNDATHNLGSNFGFISASAEAVSQKFSALEVIGVTALVNITNAAINAGKHLVSSLTIDQVNAGWDKYAQKTTAVQTIMAATAKDFTDTGEQMEYVNSQLDRLNWFTDETSYNFVDMVGNIGKFTSNGIKLDQAATSMQGIATWAAISGANAGEASRAMYNLSQAISVGSVKLMDWKSIENANMATVEFKQTAIDTAVALGTLKEAGDGTYKTLKGNEVAVTNFNEALSDGWFSSEVLLQSLDKYGAFSVKLSEATEELGITATDALEYLEQYAEGTLDLAKVQKETGATSEELKKWLDELGSEEYELGRRAFKAAQEAKTFEEAIDATKDAVSTGWMKTFELIFGNYEEAKKVWTGLANVLYDVFAAPGEARNEMLEDWGDLGGRAEMIEGLANAWDALLSVIEPAKEAFREIVPAMTGEKLYSLTKRFNEFAASLKISDEAAESISKVFKTLGYAFNNIKASFSKAGSIIFSILRPLRGALANTFPDNFGENFLSMMQRISAMFWRLSDVMKTDKVQSALGKLYEVIFRVFFGGLQLIGKFASFAALVFNDIAYAAEKVISYISNLVDSFQGLSKIKIKLPEIKIKGGASLEGFTNFLITIASTLGRAFSAIASAVATGVKSLGFDSLQGVVNAGLLTSIIVGIKKLVDFLSKSSSGLEDFIKNIKESGGIAGMLSSVSDALKDFQASNKAGTIMKIAIAIGVLALSLIALSGVDSDKMMNALVGIGGLFAELVGSLAILNKFGGSKGLQSLTKTAIGMMLLSVAVAILAGAIRKLADLNMAQIAQGLLAIAGMMLIMTVAAKYMEKKAKQMKKVAASMILFAIAVRILASSVKALSDLSLAQLGTGLLAIAAIFAIIAGFSHILKSSGISIRSGIAMIAISASLIVLSVAVEKFAKISWSDLAKGGAALAGFLLVVAGFSRLAASGGKMLAFALSLTIVAASLLILAKVASIFAKMSWEDMAKGGAAIGAFVGIIALASLIKSGKLIAAASAMLVFSAATVVLALAMAILAKLDWKGIGIGLAAIAGTFVILGVAALVLAPLITVILLLGVAVLALGTGIFALVSAVAALVAGGTALAGGLTMILTAIAGTIPLFITQLVDGIGQGLMHILMIIIEAAPKIGEAGITLIATLCSVILTCTPMIAETFFQLIAVSLMTLANGIGLIVNVLLVLIVNGINALANGIREHSEEILAAVRNLLSSIIELALEAIASILQLIPGVGGTLAEKVRGAKEKVQGVLAPESMASTGKEAAIGIAAGMEQGSGEIQNASSILGDSALSGLSPQEIIDKFKGEGDFGGMLADSMLESTGEVESAGAELGSSASDAIKQATQQMKQEGEKTGSEYASGIESSGSKIKTSASKAGKSAVSGTKPVESDLKTSGRNAGEGLALGIESKSGRIYHAAYATARQAVIAANAALKEQSPSKELFQTGAYGSIGLANGFVAYSGLVEKSASSVATGAVDAMSLSLAKVSDSVGDNMDLTPSISPVIDMSKATTAYGDISSLFGSDKTLTLMSSISGTMDANNVVLDYISKLDAANATHNKEILDAFNKLGVDILSLGDRIENLELRLDSKELVGAITPKADKAFGRQVMRERRNV